ncbi:MAG TPA: alanine--glyoxylate aminotransferase family protein [Limnochordia bacterium]|nr:alanine--glyoxylate aminotransferase family protein [Limnochordia bacterium]
MNPSGELQELNVPQRVLLGPGPSDVDPRVLRSMSTPLLGHLDPEFLRIMDRSRAMLQALFGTNNRLTLAMSGTGSAGMETCLVNLLEPGDRIVVGVNGVFGTRLCEVARRCGAEVVAIEAPWGQVLEPEPFQKALAEKRTKAVAVVHAETSTGVLQPLEAIARSARAADALMIADTVTSLGGTAVALDEWGVDAAYSGTQKCLSCPPGLSPVSFGERAAAALAARKHKVQSWYLDLSLIQEYWGSARSYHHTAPISMLYALHEALRVCLEEGLPARFARHVRLSRALAAGLEALGLQLFADPNHRAPMLTTVRIPEGVDDATLRGRLLSEFGIEIGGGLGPVKGKIWRIGLMGYACRWPNVAALLGALGTLLSQSGHRCEAGAALAAAHAALDA